MKTDALTTYRAEPSTAADPSPADIFFDKPIKKSDWPTIRLRITNGGTTTANVLEQIRAMEPMAEEDPREYDHWRLQQILRLCLTKDKGEPLELDCTCEVCGTNKCDPFHGMDAKWQQQCMACAEEDQQSFNERSRGSCEFIKPCYNPRSLCWAILFYWSHGQDDKFIFIAVDGYKTRQDAQMALQPVKLYIEWLNVKYNGMLRHWIHFTHFIGLDDWMKMKLPLSPEQFREVLRSKIEADMTLEHDVMGYYVKDAMSDHERAEKD